MGLTVGDYVVKNAMQAGDDELALNACPAGLADAGPAEMSRKVSHKAGTTPA